MNWPIKTALLSCTDKTGLKELSETLVKNNVHLISTGGTGAMLRTWGIPFEEISSFTGHPEAFQGRMKTISFAAASALLFRRNDPSDTLEAAQLNIRPIDLVICNLYAFEKSAQENADETALVENIDIGGPLMVRAAAKNFQSVTVLSSVEQYQEFMTEFKQGQTSLNFRKKMALEAFERIAAYDVAIAEELGLRFSKESRPQKFIRLQNGKSLRYGENPHQKAQVFEWANAGTHSLAATSSLQGKELSYNNMLDADAAWKAVSDVNSLFQGKGVTCAVVKHGNPCGLTHANDTITALNRAWEGDSVSAFGGIIALTQGFGLEEAKFFQDKFVEIILAPNFSAEAREYLSTKKNLRLLELPVRPMNLKEKTMRSFLGGVLIQDEDEALSQDIKSVTKIEFPLSQWELVQFGVLTAKHLKSNAIALVREHNGVHELVGAGMGQPNRLDSFLKLALPRLMSKDISPQDVVLISDAFFPFGDTVEVAAEAGVKFIVQPGGSIRDDEVIKAADKHGMSMVFTGERHFRH